MQPPTPESSLDRGVTKCTNGVTKTLGIFLSLVFEISLLSLQVDQTLQVDEYLLDWPGTCLIFPKVILFFPAGEIIRQGLKINFGT